MKTIILLFSAFAIGCSSLQKAADQLNQKATSEENTLTLTHFRGPIYISEDHYYDRENSIVYVGEKHVTVIGTTWTPKTAKMLVDEIRKITNKPILEAVDTNWHHDRAGGNAYFRSIGSKIYATKFTAQLMASGWDRMTAGVKKDWPTFPLLPLSLPDAIQDGDFQLQNGQIKAIYLGPSHTEDGIFVYFPNEKTLYGGCILKEKLGYLGSANIAGYPKTLQKLKALHLDFDTIVSGHWSSIHGPELIDQYLDLLAKRAAKGPAYEVVHFQSGKLTLGGELFKPVGNGPFPAILYNHGSAEAMMSDDASTAIGPRYVAKGWVFFMPYRRGQGLSASAGKYIGDQIDAAKKSGGMPAAAKMMIKHLTGDHLDDELAAAEWLRQQKFVDPKRIAVAGQSFGGIETVLGAEKFPFCAAVDASGGAMSWEVAPQLNGLIKKSATKSKAPMFFFQAENDFNLGPSREPYAAMISAGKVAEMKTYPAYGKTHFDGHSFTWLGSGIWFDDVFSFVEKHCANQ